VQKVFFRPALFADERQESHETGALDGEGNLPLMLRTNMRVHRVNDLRLARNKPLQKVGFLVIHVFEVLRAEKTLLSEHGFRV
jgi:hypothetical protein